MAEIWGTTPEARVLRRKMSAYPPSEATPSWMRAPPESLRPDDGSAHLHGQVHDLADLLGVGLGEAAAEDREVLGEDEGQAPVDPPVAGDDAVAGDLLVRHPEVEAAVLDELVQLLEGPLVEEQLHALARGELALRVLALEALGPAALLRAAHAGGQDVPGRGHQWWQPQAPRPQPQPPPAEAPSPPAPVNAKLDTFFSTDAPPQAGQSTGSPQART
jgi:hypothetical protein